MTEIDLESLSTSEHGYTVNDEDDDDPVLLDRDGNPVDTWRERYPYDERMLSRDEYERVKRRLQIELLELQRWSKRTGARHVIVFEGRDAAGKGGTIQRFMEHLNPRGARVVALEKPTDREKSQWYFQRYVRHMPAAGEMVLFDRSWYNRAGVEKVTGFCTSEQHTEFIRQTPMFEDVLVNEGIHLTKFWFSVSPAEQRTRFAIRLIDPVRQWKFSPMDIASVNKWEDYTAAKEEMFRTTDTDLAPWIVVKSNDKKRAPHQRHATPARQVRLRRQRRRHCARTRSATRRTRPRGLVAHNNFRAFRRHSSAIRCSRPNSSPKVKPFSPTVVPAASAIRRNAADATTVSW
jgi:polyphosphate kinase